MGIFQEKVGNFENGWERLWEFQDLGWEFLCFGSSHTAAADLKDHLDFEGDKSEAGQRLKGLLETVAGGALVPLLGSDSIENF